MKEVRRKCKEMSEATGSSFGEGGCQHGSPKLPLPESSSTASSQLPHSWEILPAHEGPRGMETRCSPSAEPSLCTSVGMGGMTAGTRPDENRSGGLFPEQLSPSCQNEQNWCRRQPEPIPLLIYSSQRHLVWYLCWSAAGRSLPMDSAT